MSFNFCSRIDHDFQEIQTKIRAFDSKIKNFFWKERKTQNGFCHLTTHETTRLFMRFLGLGAIVAGVSVVTAAALGSVTWTISLLGIPFGLGAATAIWYSFQLNNYENPEELAKFRENASRMSLEEVMKTYGWDQALRWQIITPEQFIGKYRQQMQRKNLVEIIGSYESTMRHLSQYRYSRFQWDYRVPTPSEWRGLWRSETSNRSFEEIINSYSLDQLEQYNLLEAGELYQIKRLKSDYKSIQSHYENQMAQIEREFQSDIQSYEDTYQVQCTQADQLYQNDGSVQRLKGLEMEYMRERQAIQEKIGNCKNEASSHFDRSVAIMTNHGQIPYDKLSPQDKIFYDQRQKELNLKRFRADNELRIQLTHIELRFTEERNHLNCEGLKAKTGCGDVVQQARECYNGAILSHQERKEQRLVSIRSSMGEAIEDINGRYRAYLRRIGVVSSEER